MKSPGKRVINEKRGKNIYLVSPLVSPKNILKNERDKPGKIQQTRGLLSHSVQTVIFFLAIYFSEYVDDLINFFLKSYKNPRNRLHKPFAGCSDKHSNCEQWATSGECRTNPDWMLVNCQESCGLCCEFNITKIRCIFLNVAMLTKTSPCSLHFIIFFRLGYNVFTTVIIQLL